MWRCRPYRREQKLNLPRRFNPLFILTSALRLELQGPATLAGTDDAFGSERRSADPSGRTGEHHFRQSAYCELCVRDAAGRIARSAVAKRSLSIGPSPSMARTPQAAQIPLKSTHTTDASSDCAAPLLPV